MWKEVALTEGFITREQSHEIPYTKSPKDQSYRRSSFSVEEWVQLEKAARTYWIEGKTRYDKKGNLLGYHQISRGPDKGKESDRPLTRNSLYGVNKGKRTKRSPRAKQQARRQMLYLAMRISMESGIRIGSLRKMRWGHISENKTLSEEDQQIWCLVEVLAENTKTGRWHQLSAPIARHLGKLRKLTHPKNKQDLLFRNQSTGKALSDRIWRDGLQEMLVESGLAT